MGKERISVGKTLLEMEQYLETLVDLHDLQHGEILSLVDVWLRIHRPECIEVYEDGSNPIFKYGFPTHRGEESC